MSVISRELPAPKNWQEFENLTFDIYRRLWKTNDAQLHGRQGQPQAGVDVYGTDRVEQKYTGVQCKGKDGDLRAVVTETELRNEVAKARTFQPPLDVFILATTAPNDQAIQGIARQISLEHGRLGLFEVRVTGWTTLRSFVADDPDVLLKYYRDLAPVDVMGQIAAGAEQNAAGFAQMQMLIRSATRMLTESRDVTGADDPLATQVAEIGKLVSDGSPRAAIRALERIRAEHDATASPLARYRMLASLGNAHYALDEEDRAIPLFHAAFEAYPDFPNARATKAMALLLEGKREEAEPIASAAFQDDRTSARNAGIWIDTMPLDRPMAEIEEALPPALLETLDIQLHLALRSGGIGDVDRHLAHAQAALAIAPEDWRVMATLAEALVQPLSALEGLGITHDVPAHLQADVERAVGLLKAAWKTLLDQDSSIQGRHVSANLISLLGIIGREAEADQILDEALGAMPHYPPLGLFAARRSAANDDWRGVAATLDALPRDTLTFDALLLRTHAALQLKDAAGAVLWAGRMQTADVGQPAMTERAELIEAMQVHAAMLGSADPAALIANAIAKRPGSIVVRSVLFDGLEPQDPLRAQLASEIGSLAQGELSLRERMHAAETLYAQGNYAMAADLYAVVHGAEGNYALRRRLQALNLADRRAEARRLFETLPTALRASDGYLAVGVAIYERAGLLKPALKLVESAVAQHDVLRNRLIWIQLLVRLGRADQMRDWLDRVSQDIEGTPIELIALAQLVDRYLGHAAKALSLGYRALRTGYGQPRIHLAYALGLIVGGRSSSVTMAPPEAIEAGAGVVLINDATGDELHRIIETGPVPAVERDELSPDETFAKRLLGLRVGDSIEFTKLGVGPQSFRVAEIQTPFLFAFRRTMRQFPTLFPDNPAFGSFTIDDSKGDDRFEEMFAMARNRAAEGQQLENLYRDGVIPIPMFARFSGADIFEIWENFRQKNSLGLKVAQGAQGEFEAGCRGAGAGVAVVDPLSVYAWARMGLGAVIAKLSDRLAIVQSTIDALRQLVEEREGHRGRKSGTFGYDGERYFFIELTPEAAQQQIVDARSALELAEALPLVAAESDQAMPEGVAELIGDLDPAYHDSVIAALAPKRALLTDDLGFRVIAQAAGAQVSWTQVLGQVGHRARAITHAEYRQILGALFDANYTFVQFNAADVVGELQDSAWAPNDRLRDYARLLTSETLDQANAAMVMAELLLNSSQIAGITQAIVFSNLLIEAAGELGRSDQVRALMRSARDAAQFIQIRAFNRELLPARLLETTGLNPVKSLALDGAMKAAKFITHFWDALQAAGLKTIA
ncbi:PIN domain-containing protein [Sphingomonas sp. VDB2]|uniref:PIN domain-containing protein n=1 Tax=Sphingomonas sp. VDB2 TaxID=3228751 RepID=UPI003A7F8840